MILLLVSFCFGFLSGSIWCGLFKTDIDDEAFAEHEEKIYGDRK